MNFFSPLTSRFLASVAYDTDTHELTIEFKDGATFVWENLPERTYQELISAVSPGTAYRDLGLHGTHSYRLS